MKRFVTYLYEYERGNKMKNAGFIKVDIRNGEVTMEVVVHNLFRVKEDGSVFGFVDKDGFKAVLLGEIKMHGGQGEARLHFFGENMQDSGYSIEDFVGIGIAFQEGGYAASCWEDAYAVQIAQGNDVTYQTTQIKEEEMPVIQTEQESAVACVETDVLQEVEVQETDKKLEVDEMALPFQKEELEENSCLKKEECSEMIGMDEDLDEETVPETGQQMQEIIPLEITYQKIELSQLRDLPGQSLHYSSNGFLIHGFFNFGFLILKTETSGDEKKVWLGVPGIFEKPERAMALVFGFPGFEEIPQEMTGVKMNEERVYYHKEEKREPKTGVFGCWFVLI